MSDPLVEPEAPEAVLLGRHFDGRLEFVPDPVDREEVAERRVGLIPPRRWPVPAPRFPFEGPVFVVVKAVNNRIISRIAESALQNAPCVVVLLLADRGFPDDSSGSDGK